MADLPPERMDDDQTPFSYVGVDCSGPSLVKQGRSTVKRYGCLFTCLTTRANHIKKLRSVDTDSYINALRCFSARRGVPKKICLDNVNRNRCNHILNRNKGLSYRDLVRENCGDGKKLWQALNRILSRSNSTVFPSYH